MEANNSGDRDLRLKEIELKERELALRERELGITQPAQTVAAAPPVVTETVAPTLTNDTIVKNGETWTVPAGEYTVPESGLDVPPNVTVQGAEAPTTYRCGRTKKDGEICATFVTSEGEGCRHHPDVE